MAEESEIATLQGQAFIDSVSHSMVYLLHYDAARRPASGTAVLVSLGGETYIASALHNFDLGKTGEVAAIIKTWTETSFSFRDAGTLQFHNRHALPNKLRLDQGTRVAITGDPLINREFDLIAVRLDPRAPIPLDSYPIDLEQRIYTGTIKAGASLTTVGMPMTGALKIEGGPSVLYPHTFSVGFDPNVPMPAVRSEYKSDNYLLYSYTNHFHKVNPAGYSGAPVWSTFDVDAEAIWSANPVIVGIALKHLPTSKLILAVRAQHLVALLQSDRK